MATKTTITQLKADYHQALTKLKKSKLPNHFTEEQFYNLHSNQVGAVEFMFSMLRFALIVPVSDSPKNKLFKIEHNVLQRISRVRTMISDMQKTDLVLDEQIKELVTCKQEMKDAIEISNMILKHTI